MEFAREEELALGNDEVWEFTFSYRESRHRPLNVSWGPESPYVLSGDDVVPVEAEVDFGESPPASSKQAQVELDLALVPTPASWQAGSGVCMLAGKLALDRDIASPIAEVVESVQNLGQRCGLPTRFCDEGVELRLQLVDGYEDSGYQVELARDLVSVVAATHDGLRHAMITLLQLGAAHQDGAPCGVLRDKSRFGWRGMHLDCARHYYSVPSLLRLLDLLALLKFNRLHWHLIDDEAFRLELGSYPQLAELTAMRGHGCLVPGVFGGGAGPSGGAYSASDVAQVLEHAKELGIEVMPEIELPAHAWGILQVIPGLRDPEDQSAEESVQGYANNTMNPAMPATWEFLERLIPEVASLFPFGLVHLGCDEIPPGAWTASPALERWKAERNLPDASAVQEAMMYRAAEIVISAGGRPAAWDEGAQGPNGGIGHDALLFSWSGQEAGLDAARNGYEVVMTPAQHTYMDMAPNNDPQQRGMNWAAMMSLADTVAWEPVPLDEPGLEKQIVGVQGALWSETVLRDGDHEPMIAPRILGVAESAWASTSRRASAAKLYKLADVWDSIFTAMRWQSNPTR